MVSRWNDDIRGDWGPDEPDRRYPVSRLNIGWLFISPVGRLEEVVNIEDDHPANPFWVRVWTKDTGPSYSWRLRNDTEVHAMPPAPAPVLQPEVRIVDLRHTLTAVVTFAQVEIPDFMNASLVQAKLVEPGRGWQVLDRPAGAGLVTADRANKAAARRLVFTLAREHAAALKVPVCTVQNFHSHPSDPEELPR